MKLSSFPRYALAPLTVLALATTVVPVVVSAAENPKATEAKDGSNGKGKSQVEKGQSTFKANLKTEQHVYYPGDALKLSVHFERGSAVLAASEADAHVVIYGKDGSVSTLPVPNDIGTNAKQFVKIDAVDTTTLPEGQYQLGLVVTIPDGDPLSLADWYSGFRGLLDMEAIAISSKAIPEDADGDGELDDDSDGDGLEEGEDESEESEDD